MTYGLRKTQVLLGLLVLLVISPFEVSAEYYGDLYTGAVFTKTRI